MSTKAAKWSADEVEELRALAEQGLRPSVIAARLGRPLAGVRGKALSCGIALIGERSIEGVTLRRLTGFQRSSPRDMGLSA